ncbi:hypothetical protein [Undibacterium sp. TC4M20W]|uniref:hypothetical protein n=1 Tax=Undibacterium sp. TC4M20W TaxID=3413052 RepID=UPI003BF5DB47
MQNSRKRTGMRHLGDKHQTGGIKRRDKKTVQDHTFYNQMHNYVFFLIIPAVLPRLFFPWLAG